MTSHRFIKATGLTVCLLLSPLLSSYASSHENNVTFAIVTQELVLTKDKVKSVALLPDSNNASGVVITVTDEFAQALKTLSGNNINQTMQIRIGKHIISQPTILSEFGKTFQLMTSSQDEAKKIVKALS